MRPAEAGGKRAVSDDVDRALAALEVDLRAIAASLGLRVRRGGVGRSYTYTGRTIQPAYSPGREDVWLAEVAHELGHWCAAPSEHRYDPEWGWSGSYEWLRDPIPSARSWPSEEAEEEEEALASLAGIHLLWRLGARDLARQAWDEHGWSGCLLVDTLPPRMRHESLPTGWRRVCHEMSRVSSRVCRHRGPMYRSP